MNKCNKKPALPMSCGLMRVGGNQAEAGKLGGSAIHEQKRVHFRTLRGQSH